MRLVAASLLVLLSAVAAPAAAPRIGVRRVEGGLFSSRLVDELRPGDVLDVLPSMGSPTVTALASGTMHAVESVVAKKGVNTLIPTLKAAGARDILEIDISKIVE